MTGLEVDELDDSDETSPLEQRYRRVLRLLPAAYREVWEEDMVATFMAASRAPAPAGADGDPPDDPEYDAAWLVGYGRPPAAEVLSVVLLAVRLRLGFAGTPPRALAWGEAVRLLALVGLLVHAALATAGIGVLLWQAGRIPLVPAPPADWTASLPQGGWQSAWVVVSLSWLPAYFALLYGHHRAAQVFASLALGTAVVTTAVDLVGGEQPYVTTAVAGLLVNGCVVLAIGAYRADAPPVRRRPWLLAVPVGAVLLGAVISLGRPVDGRPAVVLDWAGLCSVAVVLAGLGYLAGTAVGLARVTARWALALALLAGLAFALRSVTFVDYLLFDNGGQFFEVGGLALRPHAIGLVQGAGALAVAAPLAAVAGRALRRLPAGPRS
jgi:hypothetical protein